MRQIQVEEGLRLRFPGRSGEFDEGVEIGLLLADLAQGGSAFSRTVSAANVDQARRVAGSFGYRVQIMVEQQDCTDLLFSVRSRRPVLTVVEGDRRSA
ncbi:hypothetical protein [Methylobacterium iners]|uniref:Uncharacterized protein n=1 Tax=Methylobacterium iners TaxID=418707 RepID=A0ABQ4S3Z8_9HYPH|nr:hypothetical protein [Methylobacterium iners]GJD97132.1 hypothetical protein OCOJLMKI_4360 [Methylobacterium iners]